MCKQDDLDNKLKPKLDSLRKYVFSMYRNTHSELYIDKNNLKCKIINFLHKSEHNKN